MTSPRSLNQSCRYQFILCITALRISGGRSREFTRGDDRTLQPLDGRRFGAGQSADGNTQRRWRGAEPLHLSTHPFLYSTYNQPINARVRREASAPSIASPASAAGEAGKARGLLCKPRDWRGCQVEAVVRRTSMRTCPLFSPRLTREGTFSDLSRL